MDILRNTKLILVIILISTSSLFSQKFLSTPVLGAGRNVMMTHLVGVIGNKEIRSNVTNGFTKYNYNLLVYENGKQLKKKDIQISYNEEKYVPDGYFIKDNKLVGYFISGTKESEEVKLCIQEFDVDLNLIGKPIEIIELPKAIDPTKLLNNKSGGLFKDKVVKEQDLSAKYDHKNETILFCFSLQLTEEYNLSYAKIIIVDENYTVLNSVDYQATTNENYTRMTSQTILENKDVVVSIAEGKTAFYSNGSSYFSISKQGLLYIPANGGEYKEMELVPDQKYILKTVVAETLYNDNLVYGIHSNHIDHKNNIDNAYIGLYKYNIKNGKTERHTYEYKIKDLLPDFKGVNSNYYKLNKIFCLKDGSVLIWLIGKGADRDFGSIFFKIDKNGELLWSKTIKRETVSPMYLVGAIDYFDKSGNLNLLINCHPAMINGNELAAKEIGKLTFNSLLIQVTLDEHDGTINFNKLYNQGKPLNAALFQDSKHLGESGHYLMRLIVDGKPHFVEVDFNSK